MCSQLSSRSDVRKWDNSKSLEPELTIGTMPRLFVVFVGENNDQLDKLVICCGGQVNRVGGVLMIEKQVGDFTHVSVSPPSSPRTLSPTRHLLPSSRPSTAPLDQTEDLSSFIMSDKHSRIAIELDSAAASAFCHVICTNEWYNRQLLHHWTKQGKDTLFSIDVTPSKHQFLDYAGNRIARKLIVELVEMDDALNWLSTLGGAYSNLGEHNQAFAQRAERNARRQLQVAMKSADLFSLTKCWLFIAMSQMQQGYLIRSREILKNIYRFCGSNKMARFSDSAKLRIMCRGIWARLKHVWEQTYQTIEVETKFCVADDYASGLRNLGGNLEKKTKMVDTYYDTEFFDLLRRDHWLRLRNGSWELKYPVAEGGGHSSKLTAYRECSNPTIIVETLSSLLPQLAAGDIQDFVSRLTVLAELTTYRECWTVEEVGVVIDTVLHQEEMLTVVGEVEMVVASTKQMDWARKKVMGVADALGVANHQPKGKIEEYLRKMKPEAAIILDAMISARKNSNN